ncbi:hypothetical protein MQE36_14390 [Zhouia spongiae]|uniref:Uncharacterized protein n=1 Tax=Zhouia spongiae TaxID=2202721 RepID=A0ABY3YKT9_9FLAO|nr:hypothetical protein [Zhouia spongiae]UNY98267.1 hypothetical protein MQE36_14390 [Zhouia spongiae]
MEKTLKAMAQVTSSFINIHEKLNRLRLGFKKIKLLIENQDINAIDSLYLLLKDVEDTFRKNQINEYDQLASYRSEILASQIAYDRKVPLKTDQLETVSNILPSATQTLNNVMKPLEDRIQESQIIIKMLVNKAYDSNMIQWNDGLNFPDFIHALWRLFLKHDSFKEQTNMVLDRITETDALQLLAREVNQIQISKQY